MRTLAAFGLINEMLVYFSLGFTVISLLTYFDKGVINFAQALIVGSVFALFQIVRFCWDIYRDRQELSESGSSSTTGKN